MARGPKPFMCTLIHTAPMLPQLVSMGFTENGSKRAALAVGNSSAEAATNWVMEHMGDADFNDPLPAPGEVERLCPLSPVAVRWGVRGAQGSHRAVEHAGECRRQWSFTARPARLCCPAGAAPAAAAGGFTADPEAVANLTVMGFTERQVGCAAVLAQSCGVDQR